MDRTRSMLMTLALFLCAGGSPAADQPSAGNGIDEPCRADAKKLCQGVEPGGGRILACLKEHREEVSDACKARLAQQRVRPRPKPTPAPTPTK